MNSWSILLLVGFCVVVLAQRPPPSPRKLFQSMDGDGDGEVTSAELDTCSTKCKTRCLCNAMKKKLSASKTVIKQRDVGRYLKKNAPPRPEGAPAGGPPPTGPPPILPQQMVDCFDTDNDKGISRTELETCQSWGCKRLKRVCTGLLDKFGTISGGDNNIQLEEIPEPPKPPRR